MGIIVGNTGLDEGGDIGSGVGLVVGLAVGLRVGACVSSGVGFDVSAATGFLEGEFDSTVVYSSAELFSCCPWALMI